MQWQHMKIFAFIAYFKLLVKSKLVNRNFYKGGKIEAKGRFGTRTIKTE